MTTYNTGNPVGSTDARDLYDNAKNLDTAMNSTGSTWTDRRGVTRKTFKAAENAADAAVARANTAINTEIPAEVARVTADANTAINTEIPAEVARVAADANTAINTEIPAQVQIVADYVLEALEPNDADAFEEAVARSALRAEAARDAALIQSGVYVDEPTGRAAVANGVAFKVQGSGDVAAYEYRRVNATTVSTLIATYPAKAAYDSLKTIVGNGPKTGTFSSTLTFDDDQIVDAYLQTAAITFTLAASGHKLGVSKRITVVGNGSGITFGFSVGVQEGAIVANKLNTIYMVYVGNSTVDISIVNAETALTDTTNLLALYQMDAASKVTVSGSNITRLRDQSAMGVDALVIGAAVYNEAGKYADLPIDGSSKITMTPITVNTGGLTIVLAARFMPLAARDAIFFQKADGGSMLKADFNNAFYDGYGGRGFNESAGYTNGHALVQGDCIFVIVYKENMMRIYLNNVLVDNRSITYAALVKVISVLFGETYTGNRQAKRLYEFRVINKAYTDTALIGQLYSDIISRYALNTSVFPTASNVLISGTPSVGSTLTLNWTYNQGSAGPAGDYYIEWKYRNGTTYILQYGTLLSRVDNSNTATVPNAVGQYIQARLLLRDNEGRCSKVLYESNVVQIVA